MNPFKTTISDIWRQIQPLVQREISKSRLSSGSGGSAGSSGGGSAPSGSSYLLDNGTISLKGNLTVESGITIDGVDISALDTAYNQHLATDAHAIYASAAGQGTRPADSSNKLNRSVTTGDTSGLQGGGTLTGDLALAVRLAAGSGLSLLSTGLSIASSIAGSGLEWAAGQIKLKLGADSGLSLASGGLAVASTIAGNGLEWVAGQLKVKTGSGIKVESGNVAHDTGNFGDVHTNYAETGADETITGAWTFKNNYLSLGTGFGYLSAPSGDLWLASNTAIALNAPLVLSATTGTALGGGNRRFASIWADAIYTATLVAQNTIATIGGRIVVAPATSFAGTYYGGETTIEVKHNIFNAGDILFANEGVQLEYMLVTAVNGPSANGYSLDVTRALQGGAPSNWLTGAAIVNLGQVGDGWIDLFSQNGMSGEDGPSIIVNRRNSGTYNDFSERAAFGNLKGTYDYSGHTYGMAAGDNAGAWIAADEVNGFRIMAGNDQKAKWGTDGSIIIGDAAGANVKISDTELTLNQGATPTIKLLANGNAIVENILRAGDNGTFTAGENGRVVIDNDGINFWTGYTDNAGVFWRTPTGNALASITAKNSGAVTFEGPTDFTFNNTSGTKANVSFNNHDINLSGYLNRSPYLASVYSSTNQTAINNTWTNLFFNTAHNQGNNHGIWSSFNPSRLAVARAGHYTFGGTISFGALGPNGTKIGLRVLLNGSTVIAESDMYVVNKEIVHNIVGRYYLNINDYITIQAFQDYGSNHTIYGGIARTTFWIHEI